jgi:hypothetical protein
MYSVVQTTVTFVTITAVRELNWPDSVKQHTAGSTGKEDSMAYIFLIHVSVI